MGGAYAITGDQSQLAAVLEEDVAGRLRWVDAHAVVRDDRGRLRGDLRDKSNNER